MSRRAALRRAAALALVAGAAWYAFRPPGTALARSEGFGSPDSGTGSQAPRQTSLDKGAALETGPVRITVNPGDTDADDGANAATVCALPASAANEPWARWADLDGPRVAARNSDESVPAYAARRPDGIAVLVASHALHPASVQVVVKAGRGLYAVEKHVFSFSGSGDAAQSETLQGVVLAGPGTVSKPIRLAPGFGALLSVRNCSTELGSALGAARKALRGVSGNARPFRLISGPLGEAAAKIGGILMPGKAVPRDRLAVLAERASLSVSHAQSLFSNFQAEGQLSGEPAETLRRGFDRLDIALAEFGAVALDLVPSARWSEVDPTDPAKPAVSVELRNCGGRTLRMVKLGLVAPEGCRVTPEDQAVFRVVRPGESVRALFAIEPASPGDLAAARANLSYIAGRAPTHLRLKPF